MIKKNINKIKIKKLNNDKVNLYKNIYGNDKYIPELKYKDFIYKNKKLYINNEYFSSNKGFIIFYAPWCSHCVKMSQLFIDLAYSNINLFNIGAVNCENIEEDNDKIAIYANIKYFPTLKIIDSDGSLKDYPYEYNADNLIYYINTNI